VVQGVLTRSVRDSAALLDCIHGYFPGDPYTAPTPTHSFASALKEPPKRLKIAVSSKHPLGLPISAECARALDDSVHKLLALGHTVEQIEPPVSGNAVLEDYLNLYFGAVSTELEEWQRLLGGRDIDALVEPGTLLLKRVAQRLPVAVTDRSRQHWYQYSREMGDFLKKFDMFLLPNTADFCWPVGSMSLKPVENWAIRQLDKLWFSHHLFTRERVVKRSRGFLEMVPFTQLANITGQPAMSVPMHRNHDGFPIGVQFIAPYGDERALFTLAGQIEEAFPWEGVKPPLIRNL
jgi:amidase